MVFQANTYSVLLVSASEKNVAATLPLLPPSDFYPVSVAGSVSEAQRRLMGESFDLVIIFHHRCRGDADGKERHL